MSTSSAEANAPASAAGFVRPELKVKSDGAPLVTLLSTLAAVSAFTLVVFLVHFGFAARFGDPVGYSLAILKPLALTLPAYLLLRVALGLGAWQEEVDAIGKSIRLAALSIACYAPVIWFYLLTSPTPTFPILALSFGAIAFWIPLAYHLVRKKGSFQARVLAVLWVGLMLVAEARGIAGYLGKELTRQPTATAFENEGGAS